MSVKIERKIELNEWLISAKWYYEAAIFIVGILIYYSLSNSIYGQPFLLFSFSVAFIILINIASYFVLKKIKKTKAETALKIFSIFQIITELLFFFWLNLIFVGNPLMVMFFFLPILSSAIVLETNSAVWTALLSVILINYANPSRYFGSNGMTSAESLIEAAIFFGIFIIISLFISKAVKFILSQDETLLKKAEELEKVSEYRKNEWMQLQKAAKLLTEREMDLTKKNEELDKKIKDLTRSEKSMLSVFGDLKREREATEKEKNKTEAVISNFVDPIIFLDSLGEISLFNPAARNVFGFDDSCYNKKILKEGAYSMNNFTDLIKSKYSIKTSKELKSQDPTEEEIVVNYIGNDLTYKVITVEVTDKKGENLGVLKIFNNLTREKTLDKLKSDFISIAAHQLRTPLSAIKWAIKIVLDGDTGKLNAEQEEMLFKGYRSNERIIELVNDMLDVSRIEEGRFGYSFGDGDFLQELDFVVDSLQGKIKEKSINLILNKPKKLPSILMDRQRMTLVLQNLIENAIKYTPERGKVEVTLDVSDRFLTTRIKDNGVGIPEVDQQKMFSKFFRASNVMRMQTEGSGLGLFIVKNIIKKHGGEITFNSKEGMGTEFVFTLPLKNDDK